MRSWVDSMLARRKKGVKESRGACDVRGDNISIRSGRAKNHAWCDMCVNVTLRVICF